MRLFDTCIGRLFGRIRPGSSYRAFPWRSWDRICTILETCAGYGILINRTTTGADWSIELDPTVAAKVQPFAVVVADGKIHCYLPPSETAEAVRVNGRKVNTTQTLGTAEQPWVELGDAAQSPGLVVLQFAKGTSASDADSCNAYGSTLTWSLAVGMGAQGIGANSYYHNTPIAAVSAEGEVIQIFSGALEVTIALPDYNSTERSYGTFPEYASLEWKPNGTTQLFDFDNPPLIGPQNIDMTSGSGLQTQIVFRDPGMRGAHIVYGTIRTLLEAASQENLIPNEESTTIIENLDETPCKKSVDGVPSLVVWDPCEGEWVDLTHLDSDDERAAALPYWPQGSDETECYGSAIGDPNQSQAVNLSGRRLVGSGWGSDADFSVGGDLYCSGGVYVDASHYIHVAGDAYAPTNITIGGVNYTVLAKL